MPNPKKRTSRTRHRERRAHLGQVEPTMSRCPRCEAVGRPHTVCENCGYYRKRKILVRDEF